MFTTCLDRGSNPRSSTTQPRDGRKAVPFLLWVVEFTSYEVRGTIYNSGAPRDL